MKRYAIDNLTEYMPGWEAREDLTGDFVYYSDVEKLVAELAAVQKKLGCHRGYILQELDQIISRAESAPSADELQKLRAGQQRKPEEWETVCHTCDGSGWSA